MQKLNFFRKKISTLYFKSIIPLILTQSFKDPQVTLKLLKRTEIKSRYFPNAQPPNLVMYLFSVLIYLNLMINQGLKFHFFYQIKNPLVLYFFHELKYIFKKRKKKHILHAKHFKF